MSEVSAKGVFQENIAMVHCMWMSKKNAQKTPMTLKGVTYQAFFVFSNHDAFIFGINRKLQKIHISQDFFPFVLKINGDDKVDFTLR